METNSLGFRLLHIFPVDNLQKLI